MIAIYDHSLYYIHIYLYIYICKFINGYYNTPKVSVFLQVSKFCFLTEILRFQYKLRDIHGQFSGFQYSIFLPKVSRFSVFLNFSGNISHIPGARYHKLS